MPSPEPKKTLLDPAATYRCFAICEKDGVFTPMYLQIHATRVVKVEQLHEGDRHPAVAYQYLAGDVGTAYLKKQLADEKKHLEAVMEKKRDV